MSTYFKSELGHLYHGDCMEHFGKILNGSVDMVLCDLPYGITDCKWDIKIPLAPLWREWGRVVKENGAVVLTAQQPFATELIVSSGRMFKFRYELIWEKAKALGFLNARKMPLRAHENILVFYRHLPTYIPQMAEGKPYKSKDNGKHTSLYAKYKPFVSAENPGKRYPRSVLRFPQEGKTSHPTEKPQAMFEWLIRTYTRPSDVVLDNCMGSGTTAAACEATGRRWIGMELSEEFCRMTKERIEKAIQEGDQNRKDDPDKNSAGDTFIPPLPEKLE